MGLVFINDQPRHFPTDTGLRAPFGANDSKCECLILAGRRSPVKDLALSCTMGNPMSSDAKLLAGEWKRSTQAV